MKNKSNNKAKLKQYTKLIQLVKDIIDQWNPIELLPFYPPNEYDMEIECIATLVAKDIDTDTLAVEIQAVFQKYFGSDRQILHCVQNDQINLARPRLCGLFIS